MTDDPKPHPRPAFDAWLRLHKRDYAWAGEQVGRSREYIRRCCLPFDDPERAKPGGDLVERIIRLTHGAVRADDWHPPVADLLRKVGCRASKDRRQHEPARAAALAARESWPEPVVESVARAVIDNEDAQLTAAWVWPIACAVTAAHTGAEATVVRTVTGTRASPPRPVSQARKLAVYLTMTEGDVNATAMAAATGLNKETVARNRAFAIVCAISSLCIVRSPTPSCRRRINC